MVQTADSPRTISIGDARVHLQNIDLGNGIHLDELHLEGPDVRIDTVESYDHARITTGEARLRAMMSETNLNRLIATRMSQEAPIRDAKVALLSGRVRISGIVVITRVPIPFSIEAVPEVINGSRVTLDCRTASLGIGLPRAIVDVLDQKVNELISLDVSSQEIPIWIDELRCEPGRLSAIGRARIIWPPQPAIAAPARPPATRSSSGFTISAEPLFGNEQPAQAALTAAPEDRRADTESRRP